MNKDPYTLDIDVQVIPGRGYSASYVIGLEDGTIVHRRQIARRFSAYSEAMACALDVGKVTMATLMREGYTPRPEAVRSDARALATA